MKIDYKKLAVLLLPTFLRQPLLMSFVRVLMTPSQRLHDEHHMARDERMYQLLRFHPPPNPLYFPFQTRRNYERTTKELRTNSQSSKYAFF